MADDIIPGSETITPKEWEGFAVAIASGDSYAQAYRANIAGPDGVKHNTAWCGGSTLAKETKVAERVKFLRAQLSKSVAEQFGIDKSFIVKKLVDMVETPVGEIDEKSPYCQKLKRARPMRGTGEDKAEWETEEIHMPDKRGALLDLANLLGFAEPVKVKHEGSGPVTGIQALVGNPAMLEQLGRILRPFPDAVEAMRKGLDAVD